MKLWQPPVGTRGIDTITPITKEHACGLKNLGYDFVVRYLGSLSAAERDIILSEGLGLGLVTFAKSWNGMLALQHLSLLGMPPGATVFLDVEDVDMQAPTLCGAISTWERLVAGAGYDPGAYFGAKCLLTSEEMFALPVRKYWHSCSRVVDRFGKEAAPQCGWVMRQLFPPNIDLVTHQDGDGHDIYLRVDVDVVEADYSGRKVNLVIA